MQNPSALGAGTLQGIANVANGVQNTAVGVLNIPADATNLVSNLTTGNSVAPVISSPEWSNNLFVQNDPAHAISTFLGGQAATTLLTLGLSQLGEAGNVANLSHLTSTDSATQILDSGSLLGDGGSYALSNASDSGFANLLRNGVLPNDAAVPIYGDAAGTFGPIPAVGPVSGWTNLTGGYFSPYSALDLWSGSGTVAPLFAQSAQYIVDMGAGATINAILQGIDGTWGPYQDAPGLGTASQVSRAGACKW